MASFSSQCIAFLVPVFNAAAYSDPSRHGHEQQRKEDAMIFDASKCQRRVYDVFALAISTVEDLSPRGSISSENCEIYVN